MTRSPTSRRRLLSGLGLVAIGSLAGCTDGDSTANAAGDDETDGVDSESASGGGSGAEPGSDADDGSPGEGQGLDLREANVIGVEVAEAEGSYEFAVGLHHDDEGEEGYADWWQVERLDGTQLGRRELRHPHSEQPFIRRQTVDVPDDVDCVVVRGHDQTHGYGGRAVIITLDTTETRSIDQGSEPQSFEDADCP